MLDIVHWTFLLPIIPYITHFIIIIPPTSWILLLFSHLILFFYYCSKTISSLLVSMSMSLALCRTHRFVRQPLQRITTATATASHNTTHHPQSHTPSHQSHAFLSSKKNNQCRQFSSKSSPADSHTHSHTPADCWSCGHNSPDLMFCSQCGKLQNLLPNEHSKSASPVCYYALLSQPKTVEVCGSSLESEYRTLQKVLHPDKYANACMTERDISLANSSIVNQAYQVRKPE
jgi:hypothetical protein